jgi:hypothetical protein
MDMRLRHLSGTVFIILVVLMTVYLVISSRASEGFVDAVRCGVDLPSCSGVGVRCMNGYCKSDIPHSWPAISDLPMTPPTQYPDGNGPTYNTLSV